MKHPFRIDSPHRFRLRDCRPDATGGWDKEKARERTQEYCQRIGALQEKLYANSQRSLVILLQGMDTSGKDGTGKKVLEAVNPAGVETSNFKTPTAEERAHDFLWRIHQRVPRRGLIGVFNRSHYEDVLIVRVMGLAPKKVWEARYDQINAFEKILVENGVILLKFFLHISKAEQAERLQARLDDPQKHWKFSVGDLEMRARWKAFQEAYETVLRRCSTSHAPWHVVPADRKWYRDYLISKTICETLENLKMGWPEASEDLSKVRIR